MIFIPYNKRILVGNFSSVSLVTFARLSLCPWGDTCSLKHSPFCFAGNSQSTQAWAELKRLFPRTLTCVSQDADVLPVDFLVWVIHRAISQWFPVFTWSFIVFTACYIHSHLILGTIVRSISNTIPTSQIKKTEAERDKSLASAMQL